MQVWVKILVIVYAIGLNVVILWQRKKLHDTVTALMAVYGQWKTDTGHPNWMQELEKQADEQEK